MTDLADVPVAVAVAAPVRRVTGRGHHPDLLALDAEQGEATRIAALALLPIYRAAEKWARLLATYEVLLTFATTVDEKLAMLREIRELCEEKLGSRGLAFSWAARAYALRPEDPAMERELERGDVVLLHAELSADAPAAMVEAMDELRRDGGTSGS